MFQDVYCFGNKPKRQVQMTGRDEIKIVRRRVIFRNSAELAALKKSHRQVEVRLTILAFVIPIW
jgi:hypothetical protein